MVIQDGSRGVLVIESVNLRFNFYGPHVASGGINRMESDSHHCHPLTVVKVYPHRRRIVGDEEKRATSTMATAVGTTYRSYSPF